MDIQKEVRELVADVLGAPCDSITVETSMNNSSDWDSVAQVNILMSVEQTFNLYFDAEEFSELTSVRGIIVRVEAAIS